MNDLLGKLKTVKKAREKEAAVVNIKKTFLADAGVAQIFDDVKRAKAIRAAAEKDLKEYVLDWIEKNPNSVWANHGIGLRKTKSGAFSVTIPTDLSGLK